MDSVPDLALLNTIQYKTRVKIVSALQYQDFSICQPCSQQVSWPPQKLPAIFSCTDGAPQVSLSLLSFLTPPNIKLKGD